MFNKVLRRYFSTHQPSVLNRNMGTHQWYLHFSRDQTNQKSAVVNAIQWVRQECQNKGIDCTIGFGPSLVKDYTPLQSLDFQSYTTFKSVDGSGKEAKATQEELLVWLNHDDKGLVWRTQWELKKQVEGHLKLARETMTFNYGPSKDLSDFIDGTGNPVPERDLEVAVVPKGQVGEGGSFIIAQRWVHDLKSFEKLPVTEQEKVFGRTKNNSTRLTNLPESSHVAHADLREGKNGDESKPKRGEMSRRSTPYAFHDGSVGLYFMGFCATQAPLIERMNLMYGTNGEIRDKLTDYSNPASGSFYFAPSVEVLNNL